MYVISRRDLNPGQQATQAVHAAFEYAVTFPEITRTWHDDSSFLVLLTVEDQQGLLDLASRAWDAGLHYTLFTEPDLPEGNQITGLVLEAGSTASRICANLPLLLREEALA